MIRLDFKCMASIRRLLLLVILLFPTVVDGLKYNLYLIL